MASGDGCSANCRIERCGDGNIQAGEECDDGNTENGDSCSATCKKPDDGGCAAGGDASLPALGLAFGVLVLATRRRRRIA
jgi:MYXO-CTERM domain-containing protein